MKKTLLTKVMLLLCALVAGNSNVWATDVTFDATKDMPASGTSFTKSGITISVSSGTITNTTDYRCYKGATLTISSSVGDISSIVFTSTSSDYAGYIKLSGSTPGSLSTSSSTTTWTYATGADEVVFTGNDGSSNQQIRASKIVVTYTGSDTEYNVNLGAVTNGSINRDKDKAKAGVTVTLTATPDDGYITGEWTVTDAGSNVVAVTKTGDNTATFSMPTANVTVTATFLAKHTVTYYVAGEEYIVNRGHGTSLSLVSPTLGNLEFAGWSSTKDVASPSFVSNLSTVEADMTLYAIFVAKKVTTSYNLVEASQADWRGNYLIAYSASVFANGKAKGTDGIGSASTVQNPGSKLSGTAVDGAWGDEYHVTLEAIDDNDLSKGYLLKTQDGYYNYQTSDVNGLGGTSNSKLTASSYPITVSYKTSSEINLTLDKGQVFRYNTSSKYFRYYRSSSYSTQGKVYLYKASYDITYSLAEPFEVSISSAKYATFCDDVSRNFSASGIEVYKAASDGSKVELTQIADGIVPANTGVVLFSDEVKNNVAIPVATAAGAGDFSDNELVGINIRTMVNATESTKTNYILSNEAAGVGFYKATDGKYLAAHKAYLSTATAASDAPEFLGFDFFNMTTGIDAVNGSRFTVNGSQVYNLNGQRVANPKKGLYIVNGKKAIIK